MMGGEFATAARPGHENVQYAQTFLKRGMSYQAAAKAAGVNELTLREMFPAYQPKARALVLPARPVKREPLRFVPDPIVYPQPASALTAAVIERVAKETGIPVQGILGRRNTQPFCIGRQAAMAAVKCERGLSLKQIGNVFNRDHTTVLHGIRAHEARVAWVEFLQWAAKPDEQPDLFARAA